MNDGSNFDLFGTHLEIRNRQNPYRRLLHLGSQQGRVASPNDLRWIMTNTCGLQEAADFGIKLSSTQLTELQSCLGLELKPNTLLEDALPALDGYSLSAEVGLMRADVAMYQHICTSRFHPASSRSNAPYVLMIEDSRRCDVDGSRVAGTDGYRLDRSGAGRFCDLLEFVTGINTSRGNDGHQFRGR